MLFLRGQRAYALYILISTIIQEAILIVGLLLILPYFGVNVPIWVVVMVSLGWAVWSYIGYTLGANVLARKPVSGIEAMVGAMCRTTTPLSPRGYVRAGSELWKAYSSRAHVDADVDVMIVEVKGLIVHVAPLTDTGNGPVASIPNTSRDEQHSSIDWCN